MPLMKPGPLSKADFLAIFEGATDKAYREPLIAAGDGNGMEAWSQFFAQMERVSKAIDITTQSMFITPWSGQTNPSASGPQNATVTLTLTRTKLLQHALVLAAGTFYVDETGKDWGENGTEIFDSGRKYLLTQNAYFAPGDMGPIQVTRARRAPGVRLQQPAPGNAHHDSAGRQRLSERHGCDGDRACRDRVDEWPGRHGHGHGSEPSGHVRPPIISASTCFSTVV
jgi:hypothetical protein